MLDLWQFVDQRQGWDCFAPYALVQYSGPPPLLEKMPITTAEQAGARAVQALQTFGLLMPAQATPVVQAEDAEQWRVFFYRSINGILVYANKGLAVSLDQDGQVTHLIGRRRPLLARSQYPLRSPEEAWKLLAEGRWLTMYVDDGAPPLEGTIERFVAREVELAYVETEVVKAQQIMQPYYVFRNEQRQTLYVLAVTDPYVEW